MSKVSVETPGKLIITGEHAVVYGNEALAAMTSFKVFGEATFNSKQNICFSSELVKFDLQIEQLEELYRKIDQRYQLFLNEKLTASQILTSPEQLIIAIIAKFNKSTPLPQGLNLTLKSELPIGAGMGSSAAVIITVLKLLAKLHQVEYPKDEFIALCKSCENLQHGKSSGLDLVSIINQGLTVFKAGVVKSIESPKFNLFLVNTGTPESSTGECVSHVQQVITPQLLDAFKMVTSDIIEAIIAKDLTLFKHSITKNHKLLMQIGVVPTTLTKFAERVEKEYDGVFKVSGAGATFGESAGMGVIVSDQKPTALCEEFGYQLWDFKL